VGCGWGFDDHPNTTERQAMKATGTDDTTTLTGATIKHLVAPTHDVLSRNVAFPVTRPTPNAVVASTARNSETPSKSTNKASLTVIVSEASKVGMTGDAHFLTI
jgi:hypothetical protein